MTKVKRCMSIGSKPSEREALGSKIKASGRERAGRGSHHAKLRVYIRDKHRGCIGCCDSVDVFPILAIPGETLV